MDPAAVPYCVYVLQSVKDGNLYVGYSASLGRRLKAHVTGESKSAAPRRPFRLVLVEMYLSPNDAQRREKYLKTTTGRRMLRLMLKDTLK